MGPGIQESSSGPGGGRLRRAPQEANTRSGKISEQDGERIILKGQEESGMQLETDNSN